MKNRRYIVLILFMCALPSFFCDCAAANNGNSTNLVDVLKDGPGIILLGNETYYIDKPIYVPPNTVIRGAGSTILKASSYADFPPGDSSFSMLYFDSVTNSGIENLVIDGGETKDVQYEHSGKDYENAICIGGGSKDIVISNVTFRGLTGDGVRGLRSGSSDVLIKDCTFDRVGHDGVQNWDGNGWIIKNSYFNLYINSGIRIANAQNCVIVNNFFTSQNEVKSGYAGIELEDNIDGTNIIFNEFKDIYSSRGIGIVTVHASGTVNIYGNKFSNCPGGNIVASGIKITEENKTDGYEKEEVNKQTYGTKKECGKGEKNTAILDDMLNDIGDECGDIIDKLEVKINALENVISAASKEAIDDENTSAYMLRESIINTNEALELAGGSQEEREYAQELLNDSLAKQKMSSDLYNMSLKHSTIARDHVQEIIDMNSNATPLGC